MFDVDTDRLHLPAGCPEERRERPYPGGFRQSVFEHHEPRRAPGGFPCHADPDPLPGSDRLWREDHEHVSEQVAEPVGFRRTEHQLRSTRPFHCPCLMRRIGLCRKAEHPLAVHRHVESVHPLAPGEGRQPGERHPPRWHPGGRRFTLPLDVLCSVSRPCNECAPGMCIDGMVEYCPSAEGGSIPASHPGGQGSDHGLEIPSPGRGTQPGDQHEEEKTDVCVSHGGPLFPEVVRNIASGRWLFKSGVPSPAASIAGSSSRC